MLLPVSVRVAEGSCLGKSCLLGILCIYYVHACALFPFGFEGWVWELIVLVLDHCLSFYFLYQSSCGCDVWRP